MPYIGTSPSNGVRRVFSYTATASQTTFSGASNEGASLAYADTTYIDVYQNGVLLDKSDYTSTNGTQVVLDTAASADDVVVIIVYDVFSVADTVSKSDGGTFDGNVTMGGSLTATNLQATTIKESTGTNTAMTIDSSGRLFTPKRPAFFAMGTSYTWVTGASAGTVLTLDGTKFNIGSHFNTTNYRFTAPVDGVYQFNMTAYVQDSQNNSAVAIALNGTQIHHTNSSYPLLSFYSQNSSSYDNQGGVSACLQLSANDYIDLRTVYSSGDYFPAMCHLSGFLIG